MHFSSWRGAAGLAVVVGLLVCGCSGATDDGTSSPPPSDPQGGGAPEAPSVGGGSGTTDTSGATGTSGASDDVPSAGDDDAPASGASGGLAVCEPDAPCRGISSCTNHDYGPTHCTAYCQCPDVRRPASRLTCTLNC